jgi:hypothetical protein
MKFPSKFLLSVSCLALPFASIASGADEVRRVETHYSASSSPALGVGKAVSVRGTYLGVSVVPVEPALGAQLRLPDGQGLAVVHISPGSPADVAGIQVHDVLLKLDEQILIDPRQLSVLVRGFAPRDSISLTIVRGGQQEVVAATLVEGEISEGALQWSVSNVSMATQGAPYYGWRFFGSPSEWNEMRPPDNGPQSTARYHVGRAVDVLKFAPPPGQHAVFVEKSGDGNVRIFRPQADIVYVDDAGSMTIKVDEGVRMLVAVDNEGNEIFRGSVESEEERAALPDDVRDRLEKLETLKVIADDSEPEMFDAPAPPPGAR